jgi:hypothetical protein
LSLQAALSEHEIGVSLMAGPFTDHDALRAQLEKCLGGCTHKKRIRIHFDAGDVFNEVGLEEH